MDAQAIQSIVDLATLAKGAPVAHTALVPKSADLVSVERYLEAPTRFRRTFSTQRFGDFIAYIKKHGSSDSAVFIAPNMSKIVAVLNHGSASAPQWGDNTATLELAFEPEFDAFMSMTKFPISQRDLIDFLEDWLPTPFVSARTESGELIDPKVALGAVRRIRISSKNDVTHQQGNLRVERSALESVEASSDTGLAHNLMFVGAVYHGLPQYTVIARLGVRLTEKEPVFTLRMTGWQAKLASICADAEALIREQVGDAFPVYVGNSCGNYPR